MYIKICRPNVHVRRWLYDNLGRNHILKVFSRNTALHSCSVRAVYIVHAYLSSGLKSEPKMHSITDYTGQITLKRTGGQIASRSHLTHLSQSEGDSSVINGTLLEFVCDLDTSLAKPRNYIHATAVSCGSCSVLACSSDNLFAVE